jgi:UDP-2-acetamido-2,6-beta-L-arabino-hexul-4-ose reductase
MNLLITGASGFIGRNLQIQLETIEELTIMCAYRETSPGHLEELVGSADWVVHLAGVNRPGNDNEFDKVNAKYTSRILELAAGAQKPPIIFSSSTQVNLDNPYAASKRAAEQSLLNYSEKTGAPVYILRLPNVMGKWSRPNYNSVVATFCYNISHGLPIEIHDPDTVLNLVYIDDVVRKIQEIIRTRPVDGPLANQPIKISPEYTITLADLAEKIRGYKESRKTLLTDRVGQGFDRALYATYLSYLDVDNFSYPLTSHVDERGVFVEILKTLDSGQFSFLTAHPGVTRGMHYHHTKSEKFIVVKGQATFRYRKLFSEDVFEVCAGGNNPEVIETIPGWLHDITNTGIDELVVLIWANEVFDPDEPDTFAAKI